MWKRFPNKYHPDRRTIERFRRALSASGSFYVSKRDSGTKNYRRITPAEEIILNAVLDNPLISSRVEDVCWV